MFKSIFYNDVQFLTAFIHLNARAKNFIWGYFLVFTIKDGHVKSVVILLDFYNAVFTNFHNSLSAHTNKMLPISAENKKEAKNVLRLAVTTAIA